MKAPSYFEHIGGYVHSVRECDVIDFPDITVTEAVIDGDTMLRLDLMRNPDHILGRWYDPEEVR
jgi:hypothetical protein